MKIYKIYAIKHDEKVVYVGKSSQQLSSRLWQHKNDEKYPEKAQYFTNNNCTIVELYSSEYNYDIPTEEQYWIDFYKPASDLKGIWFNKVRAKRLTKVEKYCMSKIMLRENHTNDGEFDSDDLDDFLGNV